MKFIKRAYIVVMNVVMTLLVPAKVIIQRIFDMTLSTE